MPRTIDQMAGEAAGHGKFCVSVVIPAYNAARWIERTLRSVQQQTLQNFEIIVVDDGSSDETTTIVKDFLKDDLRISLIQQSNGGVAKARNAGIAAARSAFVALLDADDLWHPERLELHLKTFSESSDDVALVYSPCVRIDHAGYVISPDVYLPIDGHVFEQHLCLNFIGNGSAITVRTAVAREIGGYSTELRSRGAQGCEDWLFQLKVAYHYKFACVPLHLVGYRITDDNMSSDTLSMRRSAVEAMCDIELYATDVARPVFWWPQARTFGRLVLEYIKMGRWSEVIFQVISKTSRNPIVPLYLPCLISDRLIMKLKAITTAPRLERTTYNPELFRDVEPTNVRKIRPALSTRLWVSIYRCLGRRRLLRI